MCSRVSPGAAMADWESGDYRSADPRARRTAKSSAQSSKAELLAAIAARRQAQLVRRAPSPPSGLSICDWAVFWSGFSRSAV